MTAGRSNAAPKGKRKTDIRRAASEAFISRDNKRERGGSDLLDGGRRNGKKKKNILGYETLHNASIPLSVRGRGEGGFPRFIEART